MYNNLTLYYLNQMGIVPWIRKETRSSMLASDASIRLLIMVPEHLTSKARALLDKLLAYINNAASKLLVIPDVQDTALMTQQLSAVQSSSMIVSFGLDKALFDHNDSDHSIIHLDSLEHLLSYPREKKKLFMQLSLIKHHLAASAPSSS